MSRKLPRPVCPKCGSLDVLKQTKWAKCNRCKHLAPVKYFAGQIWHEPDPAGRPIEFGHILPTNKE